VQPSEGLLNVVEIILRDSLEGFLLIVRVLWAKLLLVKLVPDTVSVDNLGLFRAEIDDVLTELLD
jgi:hypothetical protein